MFKSHFYLPWSWSFALFFVERGESLLYSRVGFMCLLASEVLLCRPGWP